MGAMSQPERVKLMLRSRRAVCAQAFWDAHMPAARNRISELRAKGWVIDSDHRCQDANHRHDVKRIEYRLIAEPGTGQQSMRVE